MGSNLLPFSSRFRKHLPLSLLLVAVGSGGYLLPSIALNFLVMVLSVSLVFVLSKKDQVQETDQVKTPWGRRDNGRKEIPALDFSVGSPSLPPQWTPAGAADHIHIPANSDDEASVESSDQTLTSPESSISDEESLIEITLQSGHSLSAELVVHQQGLLELLTEIIEEDNLIEIDLAAGSVKCSRLGIKA
ncbi:unnamed protein product [Spirodela intermedia]|uniref:Uncharacterized protein n=1 Tax=Spirodela intermedia TaxID=51605 RepID=A0A7I8IHJ1_SPIIN|nr:unnamed protein product [Spirodela intermedia]CAA6657322.1 unnamed protein product [Spirodela intermedia]